MGKHKKNTTIFCYSFFLTRRSSCTCVDDIRRIQVCVCSRRIVFFHSTSKQNLKDSFMDFGWCVRRASEERESLCVSSAGSSAELSDKTVVVSGNDYTQRQKKTFLSSLM